MQKPWSLYNKEEKLRIDDLLPEHVRIILLAIPTARMIEWYACQEGDIHWQPIAAIPEYYEDVRALKGKDADSAKFDASAEPAVKEPLVRRPLFDEPNPDLMRTEPAVVVEKSVTKERRSARRYPRQLDFRISHAGKSFECKTGDISMSGLSTNESIPSWVPKNFRAELAHGKTRINIMCHRVSDHQLKIVDCESWDVMRKWIVNW